jgi:hypothetical protein
LADPYLIPGTDVLRKAMFGEIFDWAGDFRTIHIRKLDENSDRSGYFTAPERIEPDGRKAIRHLEATLRRAKTDDLARIADNLADVYAQLNLLWSEIPVEEHNTAASLARLRHRGRTMPGAASRQQRLQRRVCVALSC